VKPIFLALGIAVMLVYALHPLIEILLPYVKKHTHAIILIFFLILVPFFILSVGLISETEHELIGVTHVPVIEDILESSGFNFQDILEEPPSEIDFDRLSKTAGSLIVFLKVVGDLFFQVFIAIIISAIVLHKEKEIKESFQSIKSHEEKYFILYVNEGLKAVVYSIYLTSFVTGIIASLVFIIFGVPFPVLLGILTGIVSIIPMLGAWLVLAPLVLYFIVIEGNAVFGVELLVASFVLIVTLPDYLVRPIIFSKTRNIDTMLILLGFLMGTLAFGPVGIIVGPLIMIALEGFATIFIFRRHDKSHTRKTSKE
jgi:predicted PurR-regulated permease PerM